MIIVNQDKDEIINFDNTLNICILYDEGEKYPWEIFAGMKAPDDNYRTLGYYKTEERAKEVLQEITMLFKNEEMFHIRKSTLNNLDELAGPKYILKPVSRPKVFEMPEE